jgi:hypothetical protein
MDIVVWLRSLGLGQYEAVFRQNDIDETVLPNLTADDLKELGVASLGHRRKLLDAVAALRADANASPATTPDSAATEVSPRDTAERRQVMVMFSDLVGSGECRHSRAASSLSRVSGVLWRLTMWSPLRRRLQTWVHLCARATGGMAMLAASTFDQRTTPSADARCNLCRGKSRCQR